MQCKDSFDLCVNYVKFLVCPPLSVSTFWSLYILCLNVICKSDSAQGLELDSFVFPKPFTINHVYFAYYVFEDDYSNKCFISLSLNTAPASGKNCQ